MSFLQLVQIRVRFRVGVSFMRAYCVRGAVNVYLIRHYMLRIAHTCVACQESVREGVHERAVSAHV